jgi:hypothetical protein
MRQPLSGWFGDWLTSDGFAVFASAFLGALFDFAANWWHTRQESNAQRGALEEDRVRSIVGKEPRHNA